MLRQLALISVVLLLIGRCTLFAAPAGAAELKVLELVPDDVLAVAVVPQLKNFDTKISSLGGPLKFPVPPPIATGFTVLGFAQGLDETRPVALALVPTSEKGDAVGLTYLPISDYDKLIGQLSPQDKENGISQISLAAGQWLAAKKGDYAVLAGEASIGARKALDRALARRPRVPESIAPLANWISGQDAALAVSHAGMTWIAKVVEELKSEIPASQQARAAPAMDAYKNLLAAVERETEQVGFGLRIENDATIRLASQMRFVPGGDWAKAGANVPPLSNPPLSGLPTGTYFIAFDGAMSESMGSAFSDFFGSWMKVALNSTGGKASDDDLKKLAEAMKGLTAGYKSMAMMMGVPKPGQSMYADTYALMRVDNAQEFIKTYQSRIEEYAKVLRSLNTLLFGNYEAKKSTVDGLDVVEITYSMEKQMEKMKQDSPATAPQTDAVWKMMFGPERNMKMYYAPAGNSTVVSVFMDPAHLKPAIEAAKSPRNGVAADAGVKTTIALLPQGAQWVLLLSPGGMVQFAQTIMQATIPQMPFRIPDFPKTPPIGAAARATAEGLEAQIIVPVAVLEGVGTVVQQVQQAAVR